MPSGDVDAAASHPHFIRRRQLIEQMQSPWPWKRWRAHRELLALEERFDRWWRGER